MSTMRRRIWGGACGLAALAFLAVALLVLVSKFTLLFEHPFSFAVLVLVVALVGAVACAREARRALT